MTNPDPSDSDPPARPDGWRCLCEGDHDEGCPWGPYLAALDEQEADRG